VFRYDSPAGSQRSTRPSKSSKPEKLVDILGTELGNLNCVGETQPLIVVLFEYLHRRFERLLRDVQEFVRPRKLAQHRGFAGRIVVLARVSRCAGASA
jgi:hypothetical protein